MTFHGNVQLVDLSLAPVGSRWVHNKRRVIGVVTGHSTLQVDGPWDMAVLVQYREEATGEDWSRPWSEFLDGRYTRLPAPPPTRPTMWGEVAAKS